MKRKFKTLRILLLALLFLLPILTAFAEPAGEDVVPGDEYTEEPTEPVVDIEEPVDDVIPYVISEDRKLIADKAFEKFAKIDGIDIKLLSYHATYVKHNPDDAEETLTHSYVAYLEGKTDDNPGKVVFYCIADITGFCTCLDCGPYSYEELREHLLHSVAITYLNNVPLTEELLASLPSLEEMIVLRAGNLIIEN